ncbi:MAG: type II secretion system GspH family protein [Planctomycetaceae bacterium]|nr:type II secretion system GspH family protein [Planctomycetaceae bacterium]
MKKRFAFTLVELLVVISVIAALLAILLPVLNRARANAAKIVCAKNLGQISIAMGAYAVDWQNQIITAREFFFKPTKDNISKTWFVSLLPYVSKKVSINTVEDIFANSPKIWFCPKDKDPYPTGFYNYPHGKTLTSYALNGLCSDNEVYWSGPPLKLGPAGGFTYAQIPQPSSCMLMTETSYASQIYDAEHKNVQDFTVRRDGHHRMTSGFYHSQSMNVSYVDGHVGNIKGREVDADEKYIPSNYKTGKFLFWPKLTLPTANESPAFWGPGY